MKKKYKLQSEDPLWTGDIDTNSNVSQFTGL